MKGMNYTPIGGSIENDEPTKYVNVSWYFTFIKEYTILHIKETIMEGIKDISIEVIESGMNINFNQGAIL